MLYRLVDEKEPRYESGKIYVTLASLDSDLESGPTTHVSFEERLSWFRLADDLPKRQGKDDQLIDEPETNT